MMELHETRPRLCRNDGLQPTRDVMLSQFDAGITNVQRCVHWLTAQGVAVLSVGMKRGPSLPQVMVASDSYLHQLFGPDCACITQRPDGALTRYTWAATRYGVLIVWEEVCG